MTWEGYGRSRRLTPRYQPEVEGRTSDDARTLVITVMTRRITIHIGDDQARVLEALARRRRHSLSAEIRRAAMRHIDAEEP
jgi:hypothetical protein